MLERLAYAFYLGLLIFSFGLAWTGAFNGVATGDFTLVALGSVGLVGTRFLHVHGYSHWHFQQWADSLDRFGACSSPGRQSEGEAARARRTRALLERIEAEPDVWKRGELRREVGQLLEQSPTLREEVADLLAGHPEL